MIAFCVSVCIGMVTSPLGIWKSQTRCKIDILRFFEESCLELTWRSEQEQAFLLVLSQSKSL